ncbi:MAG: hypothetical protein EA398_15250, partial [Deltaproteobacteria bacterium]
MTRPRLSPLARRSAARRRLGVVLVVLGVSALLASAAHARRPAPMPTPVPAQGSEVRFMCDTPVVDPPRSVVAAYEEFYACVEPEFAGWIEEHPEAAASLDQLYDRWAEGRGHDLRDRPEAARWARRHAVDFSHEEVELSRRQVEALAPTMQGLVARVPGTFQRLFVDRAAQRLFLTTDSEGLVSLDISERYAFEVEGRMGTAGATDFFIIDERTAILEETTEAGGNRDLVVMDISDRTQPREVSRLRGVLPSLGGGTVYHGGMSKIPPTFDQYRLMREGRMGTRACGNPPVVSSHPGVHCRADGSCYRRETVTDPGDRICERIPPAQGRIAIGRVVRDTDGGWAEREQARPQPRGQAVGRGAPVPTMADDMMVGGSAGAVRTGRAAARPSAAP